MIPKMPQSEFAGKTVVLKDAATHPQYDPFGGEDFVVEDWWINVGGRPWHQCEGNPACIIYAIRSGQNKLPSDSHVLYGKLGGMGCLIHETEIEKVKE